MADTMYRRPLTLQDVLLGENSSIAPPVAPAQPAPANQDYGLLTPQQQQSALEALLRPTDMGPEPTVDKRSIGAEIFSGLGDALGAYASGITGAPRTDYLGRYFGRREQQRQEQDQFRKQAALIKTQDERQKAEFLISRDERSRIDAETRRSQKELKDLTLANQAEDRAARVAAAADTVAARREEIAARERIADVEAKARTRSDELQVALHNAKKTDDADKDQHAEYKQVRMWAVAKKGEILNSIAKGEVTTDQVRQQLADMVDASDLTGKYREAAVAFLEAQIGAPLAKHDFAQQYEPQGPEKPADYPVPAGTPTLGTIKRTRLGGGF